MLKNGLIKNFLLSLLLAHLDFIQCGQKRSWLGPLQFYDGEKPSPRDSQGLASMGNRLYIFGGENLNGVFTIQSSFEIFLLLN